MEERVGTAVLPLTSCFHPLESVVFQNRGACSQVSVHLNLSATLQHAAVICEEQRDVEGGRERERERENAIFTVYALSII